MDLWNGQDEHLGITRMWKGCGGLLETPGIPHSYKAISPASGNLAAGLTAFLHMPFAHRFHSDQVSMHPSHPQPLSQ